MATDSQLLKLLELPVINQGERGVFCYVNEVTFRPHSRQGLFAWRTNHLLKAFITFCPTCLPFPPIQNYLGREEELEIRSANDNDLVSHDYVMKPPQKTWKDWVQKAFSLLNVWKGRKSGSLTEGNRSSVPILHTLPCALLYLSIDLNLLLYLLISWQT